MRRVFREKTRGMRVARRRDMRTLLAVLSIASTSLACSSSDTGSSGDANTDTNTNPCEGLGCASLPGMLWLAVVDGSGAIVPYPTFSEKGVALSATCNSKADAGAGKCPQYVFANLSEGTHDIAVTAAGYDNQTITATIEGPSGCCGQGPIVNESVTLTPINGGDAATDASDASPD